MPIIKEMMEMNSATCDNCGDQFTDRYLDQSHYFDEDNLCEKMEGDWHITDDGKCYCDKCFEINDDDELVIKPNPNQTKS